MATKCEQCDGCGKIVVDDSDGTMPYSDILEMAKDPQCNMTFYLMMHPPQLCPKCGGTGDTDQKGGA